MQNITEQEMLYIKEEVVEMPEVIYQGDLPALQEKCTNKRNCKCNREGRTVCKAGNTTRITQIWNGNKGREFK